ncbi:hypothetical protein A2U01_0046221, partial [Trifolium medium]|nr:hypothetical protein [Trifolium medium]
MITLTCRGTIDDNHVAGRRPLHVVSSFLIAIIDSTLELAISLNIVGTIHHYDKPDGGQRMQGSGRRRFRRDEEESIVCHEIGKVQHGRRHDRDVTPQGIDVFDPPGKKYNNDAKAAGQNMVEAGVTGKVQHVEKKELGSHVASKVQVQHEGETGKLCTELR